MTSSSRVTVSISKGNIRGTRQTSKFSHQSYYSFFGIPYAEPPVGANSFKPPRKKRNWSGVLDCTREKGKCIQFNLNNHEIEGGEDCLYLNVHTPELLSDGGPPKPVMVALHPGGHLFGSSAIEDFGSPDVLMHRNIIYVTLNYRLEFYGFLNLNIRECNGNMGLKDIIMALKWVKENIHHFNGDPENITAIGPSSGSSIYHLLLCLPSTEGLFHKAILMGDIIFNNFVEYRDSNQDVAFILATLLQGKLEIDPDPQKLLEYFQSQDPRNILDMLRQMHYYGRLSTAKLFPSAIFMPSVEKVGSNRLITVSPRKLIPNMRTIPTIMGFCQLEPVFGFVEARKMITYLNFKQTAFFENRWGWMRRVSKNKPEMIEEILKFYYQDGDYSQQTIAECAEMCTDQLIFDSYDTVINPVSTKLPQSTFVYRFEHMGSQNEQSMRVKPVMAEDLGKTIHLDDFFHLCNVKSPQEGTDDYKVVDMLAKWFTNFAAKGNPNNPEDHDLPNWPASNPDSPSHLRILAEPEVRRGNLLSDEKMEFWISLKKKYYSRERLDSFTD